MTEIWKDIIGYEGLYKISNLGRVKTLERFVKKNDRIHHLKERIRIAGLGSSGYLQLVLCVNNIKVNKMIHQLVAESFLNHKPNRYNLVVNHKDFNKQNNNVGNLEIVSNRENSNKKHLPSSSCYVGVVWNKKAKKWASSIYINGKLKHLGLFTEEILASEAYQSELAKINSISN